MKTKIEFDPKIEIPEEAWETLATLSRMMFQALVARDITPPMKVTISYSLEGTNATV